jgi:hypothetical protein
MCWHPDPSTHTSAVQTTPSSQGSWTPTQDPPAHVSPVVQDRPSLQAALLLACAQPDAGTHESVVQTFASSQFKAVPGWHAPATHVSAPLQTLPSSHCAFVEQLGR